MHPRPGRPRACRRRAAALAALALLGTPGARADGPPAADDPAVLRQRVDAIGTRLEALRRALFDEEERLAELRRALAALAPAGSAGIASRAVTGASGVSGGTAAAGSPGSAIVSPPAPVRAAVGPPVPDEARPAAVAPIFEQPGVLTPAGHGVLEPSLQYAYSSSSRIALVGPTVIPALFVGLIDVREVKRNTFNATLTGRWGVTSRFELEARVPYTYRSDTSLGREVLQLSSTDAAFAASGHGLGDVELTGRYQFNDAAAEAPIWVGSLRLKSRTGRDPFQVETSTQIAGLRDGVQTSLPTGSGFYGVQPALSGLVASDPAVFFGTVSYLHNFARHDVERRTDAGPEALGTVAAGDVIGFNFGMGLALNEKSSFSLGYDHASVGRTMQNGQTVAGSVRVQLGTLLLGYAYKLSNQRSLALSLGAGVTRDTPDVTLTVRLPVTF